MVRGLDEDRIPDLVAAMVAAGARVHAVDPGRRSLEDLFLDLVRRAGDRPREPAPGPRDRRPDPPRDRPATRRLGPRGLAVVSVVLVGWGTERLVSLAREEGVDAIQLQIGVSQVLILIAFMFSFVLAMSAAFLAAPAIASDVETGTVHAMLARPLRRAELVVGRWLGLSIVVAVYAVLAGLLAIAVVALVSGHGRPSRSSPSGSSRSRRSPSSRLR